MKNLSNIIGQSFEAEFEQKADSVRFNESNGFVIVGSKTYYCVLNARGVKKNSWRIEC